MLGDYEINRRRTPERVRNATRHIVAFFPHTRAMRLDDPTVVESYVRHRQEQGASNGTINNEISALRRACELAHDNGLMPFKPRIEWLARNHVSRSFIPLPKARLLIDALPPHLQPLIEIMLVTGWREHELKSLRRGDLDVASGLLTIDAQRAGKGCARDFRFAERPLAILVAHLTGDDDAPLFHYPDGSPVKDIRRRWAAACKVVGVKSHGPDDLRLTAARLMSDRGVPGEVIQQIMGLRGWSLLQRAGIPIRVQRRATVRLT